MFDQTDVNYLIPAASGVPDVKYGHVETPSNSLGGYMGMGEGGAVAWPARVLSRDRGRDCASWRLTT